MVESLLTRGLSDGCEKETSEEGRRCGFYTAKQGKKIGHLLFYAEESSQSGQGGVSLIRQPKCADGCMGHGASQQFYTWLAKT